MNGNVERGIALVGVMVMLSTVPVLLGATAHMPKLELTPQEIESLVAYLASLK